MVAPGQIDEQAQREDIAGWRDGLGALHARIAGRFARAEVRARAGRYLAGLIGRVERKNGWQLAEHVGEAGPQGRACSACSTRPTGTPRPCATTCAPMSWSTRATRAACW